MLISIVYSSHPIASQCIYDHTKLPPKAINNLMITGYQLWRYLQLTMTTPVTLYGPMNWPKSCVAYLNSRVRNPLTFAGYYSPCRIPKG